MTREKTDYDVFISYSRTDTHLAREIAKALSDKGVKVFYDESEIHVGDSIRDIKEEALEHSNYFLLLVSPDYISSQWTNFEMGVALSRDPNSRLRRIFPIITGELDPKSMPVWLSDIAAINAKDYSVDEIASRLSAAMMKEEPEPVTDGV